MDKPCDGRGVAVPEEVPQAATKKEGKEVKITHLEIELTQQSLVGVQAEMNQSKKEGRSKKKTAQMIMKAMTRKINAKPRKLDVSYTAETTWRTSGCEGCVEERISFIFKLRRGDEGEVARVSDVEFSGGVE